MPNSGQTKRIVFFGNERLISGLDTTDAPILTGLITRGYNVVAVVSHYSESKSRNQRPLEVAEIAKQHDIPLYTPHKPTEISAELQALQPNIAVLVAYGRIISQSVIDLFPQGIVNIHPSLLPKYRGPTPIESAILNGDKKTGVSIMQLSAGMDDGPVYAQQAATLTNETKYELYSKLVTLSTDLFFAIFPQILDNSLQPTPQSEDGVSYSKLLQKSDGIIDWHKSARQIEREIRAYANWPKSRTTLGPIECIITSAEALDTDTVLTPGSLSLSRELLVGCGSGTLRVTMLQPLGKKEMPVQAFLSGYGSQLVKS